MNILFTICGRAGSKGFKNKNLKEMNGVPLVYYTLASIKCYMEKHPENSLWIAVNTDSEQLKNLVRDQTELAVIFVERKEEHAGDITPKIEVIKDAFIECKMKNIDVVIDLDITSPMRRVQDIENIINEFKKGIYDLVFSVVEARRNPYFNMVEKKEDDFYRKICQSQYTARQQAPQIYEMNASIYAYSPTFLEKEITSSIIDYNCGVSAMPDYLVLDIDSEEDFKMMQYLHIYYCNEDSSLNEVFNVAKTLVN